MPLRIARRNVPATARIFSQQTFAFRQTRSPMNHRIVLRFPS
jgi:hypothetical protein